MHTCYVPADAVVPRPGAPRWGARRARRRSTSTACPTSGSTPALVERGAAPGARPSWPPSRSRTCGSTSRTATAAAPDAEDDDVLRAAAALAADRARPAPRRRSSGSASSRLEAADPAPRRPHPGPRSSAPLGAGPLPTASSSRCPRSPTSSRCAACPAGPRRAGGGARRGRLRPRAADRDPAGGARPRRRRHRRPDGARRRAAAASACTTAPTTTARRSASPPRTRPRTTRPPTTPSSVMQVAVAGTGAHAVDGSTNVLPVGRPRAGARRPGSCTPGWSAGRWNAASTRAGTCTRPSWSTRYVATYAFFRAGAAARPPAGCAPTWTGSTAGVLDEPATARALAVVRPARAGLRRGRRRRRPWPRRVLGRTGLDALALRAGR